MSCFWLRRRLKTICLVDGRHFFTPWNVPVSLIMAMSRMLRCSNLNTFMTCLQVIPCSTSGQLHCGHSYDGVWMVHTLGVWLMDATNVMSFPSWHNKTLESWISQALNISEVTMLSCFLFFTYSKACTTHHTSSE